MSHNPAVDVYLTEGCGRCPLVSTPQCKVNNWRQEMELIRSIVLECGLTEERKWGVPCYTFAGSNILLMGALKDYCMLSFFKGALLKDEKQILFQQTENVQAARILRFTSTKEVAKLAKVLKAYIREAVELEKAGAKVKMRVTADFPVPEELQIKMNELPALKKAFYALTPGRQRGYLLHFSAAKQSQTRFARIEKCMSQIMQGKGLHD